MVLVKGRVGCRQLHGYVSSHGFTTQEPPQKGGILLFVYTVSMNWASKRRFIITSILAAVAIAIVASVAIAIFYDTPTCMDRKKNQDETGIDCGGSCARVCEAEALAPSATFTRPIPSLGRTDVIAYVVNPNTDAAAKNVRFTIELYGADGIVVTRKEGTVDLPPDATVPVYLPNVYSSSLPVARAFLTFDPSSFAFMKYKDQRIIPRYNDDAQISGVPPRITASFTNPSAQTLRNIPVVVTVFDAEGNAIAATQTLLTELPPQGRAEVVFVWSQPFVAVPTRVDVVPVVPL